MLKKKCAMGGLIIATAAGALLTCQPASAAPAWGGGGWGGRFFHSSRVLSAHRNFNANENALFNRIRLRIHNRNNNIAIARNDQAQAQAERQRQRQRQFFEDPPAGAPGTANTTTGAPAA